MPGHSWNLIKVVSGIDGMLERENVVLSPDKEGAKEGLKEIRHSKVKH